MSAPQVASVLVGLIDCPNRLWEVDQAAVEKLALSMQVPDGEGGVIKRQITPITVRPSGSGRYLLVVGAHRLGAAALLGWSEIDAIIKELNEAEAEEEEVDENLYRRDLTGADRTFFVTKKLELYTYSGGKFKRGRDLRKGPTVGPLDGDAPKKEVLGFYQTLQDNFGIKRSTAKKLVRRGRNISPALWGVIRKSKKPVPEALLDKLAALSEHQRDEVEQLVVIEGNSMAQAVRSVAPKNERPAPDPEKVADGMASVWLDWNFAERSRFIKRLKGFSNAR